MAARGPAPLAQKPVVFSQPSGGDGSLHPLVWTMIGGGVIAVFFVFTLFVYAWGRASAARSTVAQGEAPPAVAPPVVPAASPPAAAVPSPARSTTLPPQPPFTPPAAIPPPAAPSSATSLGPPAAPVNASTSPKTASADWGEAEKNKPAVADAGNSSSTGSSAEFGSGIPLPSSFGKCVFGPAGCPVVVIDQAVFDIHTQKLRTELTGRTEFGVLAVLSPQGNYFAAGSRSPNQQETDVIVWDTLTGKKKFSVPGEKERYVDTIYLSDKQLFLGSRLHSSIDVWDLETGLKGKPIEIEGARFGRGDARFTLAGDYLATTTNRQLVVFKTTTGKMAAHMAAPKDPMGSTDSSYLSWLESLEFSADNQELAGVSRHSGLRLFCWDNRGKLVFDQPLSMGSYAHPNLDPQWFPNRQGWLIDREIIDRASGKSVLSVRTEWSKTLYARVLDDKRLLGNFPANPNQLHVLEIPWEKIRAAQAAMKSKAAAFLTPETPVGVLVEIDEARGDKQEISQALETAFTERLKLDGFKVGPGGKSYFCLKFVDKPGELLPIFEREKFSFRGGRDTGRTAQESKGDLVVELLAFGKSAPLWRETLNVASGRSFTEEITDETIRKSMLESAARQIKNLKFPYFIPEAGDLPTLPIILQ